MGDWRDAKGIMSSDLIPLDMSIVEPFKSGEWVAVLSGIAEGQGDNYTYMRLHNTISFMERDLLILHDAIERIAEHADVDGAGHIAKQLRALLGET